jgi:hypothetical protein
MAAPKTRRTRRRVVAPSQLPRPTGGDAPTAFPGEETAASRVAPIPVKAPTRRPLGVRAHHVTEDYSYVRSDLLLVAAVSVVSLAFVVGMSFVF